MTPKLDDDLISKIRLIQMRAKYLSGDLFAGRYLSAFKGHGMEFEEVREYQPGDEIRHIDWNVTARMNRPFIKLHRDERELTVLFLVDVSGSAHFGTGHKLKKEIAAEITALLAYSALRNNDKAGLIVFSDHVEHYLPPKKGRGHVWRLIRDILSYESRSSRTDLRAPLEFLGRVQTRRAVVFLLSDFQAVTFPPSFRVAAKRHDLVAITLSDPRERALPAVGFLELEDAETGETLVVRTGAGTRRAFRLACEREERALGAHFAGAGVDRIAIDSHQPYIDPILKFFRQRDKRAK